jgi:hypothetical protein
MAGRLSSQATQEVYYILLLGRAQQLELSDHAAGFRAAARVIEDGRQQVVGAPVVNEVYALPNAPERRGAELRAIGVALRNAIGKPRSHIMHGKVAEWVDGDIAHRRVRGGINQRQIPGRLVDDVTARAADINEGL